MLEKGDAVVPAGKLKKVVDFLSSADKETLRILASFFEGDSRGAADAKRLQKPHTVVAVFPTEGVVAVEVTKDYVWDEKEEYWAKAEVTSDAN